MNYFTSNKKNGCLLRFHGKGLAVLQKWHYYLIYCYFMTALSPSPYLMTVMHKTGVEKNVTL